MEVSEHKTHFVAEREREREARVEQCVRQLLNL